MGQGLYPFLREEAAAWLADHPADHPRYFKRRRLTGLDLPGGSAVRAGRCRRSPVVRKVVRTPRAVGK
ncbi:hypothetical protein [Streptomyces diastaticus]|uniref:hypothetical protein n=1 Tax=Streptomyces diastaticus TaxID=1956 RepID=UPI0035D9B106